MSLIHPELSGKRVLVTGATGFLGGRLVERLCLQCGAQVRALVRGFCHASRIGRFPIEMVPGDVTQQASVERASEGCDLVFHCAYGSTGTQAERRQVNVVGTRNVLDAALRHHARRVVFLSTVMVYGIPPDGDLDETAPRRYTGAEYGDSKIDAEKLALDFSHHRGLPVSVLQPTTVYGPYSQFGTMSILDGLRSGKVMLINGGQGTCNPVYLDDVVNAMLLAGTREQAVGEAFLISGPSPITWREFYAAFERMLGFTSTVSMSAEQARNYYAERQKVPGVLKETLRLLRDDDTVRNRILTTREIDAAVKAVKFLVPRKVWGALRGHPEAAADSALPASPAAPQKPLTAWSPLMIRFYACKARVRIDKARRLLGYEPAFDLDAGMRLTEQWARWANLLG